MALSAAQKTELLRWCGVPAADESAGLVLESCWNRAVNWYKSGGVTNIESVPEAHEWLLDLASWFYDNRGNDKDVPLKFCLTKYQFIEVETEGGNGTV